MRFICVLYAVVGLSLAFALVLGVMGPPAECRAEEIQRRRLSREFVLQSDYVDVGKAINEWQAEGEAVVGALQQIALTPLREERIRWQAAHDLRSINSESAMRWYVLNLELRVPILANRGEPVPNYPCASELADIGWPAVVLLVQSAETRQSEKWLRLAGEVISRVARKQARAVVAALERTNTGLSQYLGD